MTHIGRSRKLGIALEEVYGIEKTPINNIPFLECSMEPRHTPIADTSAKGTRMEQGKCSVKGKKWGEGAINVVLNPETAPYFLTLALGDIKSVSGTGATYKHTITQAEKPLSATICVDKVVNQETYAGAVINNLELSFADDVVSLNTNLFSKFPTDTGSVDAEQGECATLFTFANAQVKIGNSVAEVRDFSLSINNNAEMLYTPSDNDVNEVVWKALNISGSISMKYEDTNERTDYINLGKKKMDITFTSGTDKITITIPAFRVDDWNTTNSLDDVVHQEFDFVVEGTGIEIEVINKVENYLNENES